MIPVNDAVEKAGEFAVRVLGKERATDLLLEEMERGTYKDREVWYVTLSMPRTNRNPYLMLSTDSVSKRDYKTFTVDSETGDVLSMKIRDFVGVE